MFDPGKDKHFCGNISIFYRLILWMFTLVAEEAQFFGYPIQNCACPEI
jgi:hypothetical protein